MAGCDLNLFSDQVQAGDHLGDRVLDLESGVHLQEVKFLLRIHQEFNRPGIPIATGPGHLDGGLAHSGPQGLGHDGRGTFLDDFLMSPLYGALPFSQMNGVPEAVGQDLKLDMAGALEVFLQVDRRIPESAPGFGAGIPNR